MEKSKAEIPKNLIKKTRNHKDLNTVFGFKYTENVQKYSTCTPSRCTKGSKEKHKLKEKLQGITVTGNNFNFIFVMYQVFVLSMNRTTHNY